MGKVESTIRSEILRLAKKEVRSSFIPLKREMRNLRLKVSRLIKNVSVLDRLAKERIREDESKRLKLESPPEEVKASRFTPQRIRLLRQRLGISQKDLAVLTKVSIGAVGSWEKGKFEPKADKKSVLLALRKLRKRGVRKILAETKRRPGQEKAAVSRKAGNRKQAKRRSRRPRKKA